MKTIYLIVGESACGKDTLVNLMCHKNNMKQLISYSTRPKRDNEGRTHIFIESSEVQNYKDDMVAYTVVNGYEYFATSKQLEECDFYIIDRDGAVLMKDKLKDDKRFKFVTIYITAPFEVRYRRAMERGDSIATYLNRSMSENTQFTLLKMNNEFDYAIANYDLNHSLRVLQTIVDVERCGNETL